MENIEKLHFGNPLLSSIEGGFSTEFLFGIIPTTYYTSREKQKRERAVMKHVFESRIRMDPNHFNHFWVRRVGGRVYFREYNYYTSTMLAKLLKANLLEVIPGTEDDMKREEVAHGGPAKTWHRLHRTYDADASDLLPHEYTVYKVRVCELETNDNLRMDIASLGIPPQVKLKAGVEEFLALLPPQWLLHLCYDAKEHAFSLFGIQLHRMDCKTKAKKPPVVQYHSQYCRPAKRQRIVRLPDQVPVTYAPVISVSETLCQYFPATENILTATAYTKEPRTIPTWTGRVRKTRTWEMEAEIATGERAFIPYGKWKKNSVHANSARTTFWSQAGHGQQYGYVGRDQADAGVTPFDF
jgi:hypothetical protein